MDADDFDAVTRTLIRIPTRRGALRLLGGLALAGLLGQTATDAQNKKRRKKRKKPCPYPGQRRCGNRCIGTTVCCTDVECRSRGECAACVDGECQPDGRICVTTYGRCSSCNHTTLTCTPLGDGTSCDTCRVCQGGNCVGCLALGECAGCTNGHCIPDGTICLAAYGPCSFCTGASTPFTCQSRGAPCAVGGHTQCCREDQTCCSDGCTNLETDWEHCGSCDRRCVGLQVCEHGDCRCPDPLTWCEGARSCILAEQTCCGSRVCAEGQVCCGSGDTARCSSSPC